MQPFASSMTSVVGAAGDAAAEDQLAVDADVAELVDDQRQAPAAGGVEQVADQRRLAGAEEAGDDGGGDLHAFMVPFKHQRQAGGDEHHAVGDGGDRLVEPAGVVAEGAPQRRRRHDAETDLVADQHDRTGEVAEAADQAGGLGLDARGRRPAGSPATTSGSRPGPAAAARRVAQRRGEVERLLDRRPRRAAAGAVHGDPLRHLRIAGLAPSQDRARRRSPPPIVRRRRSCRSARRRGRASPAAAPGANMRSHPESGGTAR